MRLSSQEGHGAVDRIDDPPSRRRGADNARLLAQNLVGPTKITKAFEQYSIHRQVCLPDGRAVVLDLATRGHAEVAHSHLGGYVGEPMRDGQILIVEFQAQLSSKPGCAQP